MASGTVRQTVIEVVRERTNEFSIWLWVLYFLNAVTIAFPAIAYTDWLIYDVQMPLDKQNDYYAFSSIPFTFKPLYAIISDQFPLRGSHRRSWLCVSALGTAVMYLVQSLLVTSTLGAFASSFLLQLFYAFSELLLGSCLMDVAHKDMRNAGAVQAMATGARFAGSIAAALANFGLYPPGDNSGVRTNARTVIALTALSPLLVALISPVLPEKEKVEEDEGGTKAELPKATAGNSLDTIPSPLLENDSSSNLSHSHFINQERDSRPGGLELQQGAERERDMEESAEGGEVGGDGDQAGPQSIGRVVRFYAALFLAEAVLVWVTLKAIIPETPFYSVLSVFVALAMLSIADLFIHISSGGAEGLVIYCHRSIQTAIQGPPLATATGTGTGTGAAGSGAGWYSAMEGFWQRFGLGVTGDSDWITIGPALFLFLYNATPTPTYQYSSFQFQLFEERPYYLVYLSLLSEGMALVACILYGVIANRKHVRVCIAVTTVLSAATGLLSLPLLSAADMNDSIDMGPAGSLSPYQYALLSTCVMGLVGQLAFIPLQVLATESTPSRYRLLAYAIYLSFLDAGNTVSDWITSPLVTLFGTSYDDYSGLFQLTVVASCTSVAVLVLLPAFVPPRPPGLKREDQEDEDEDKGEEADD